MRNKVIESLTHPAASRRRATEAVFDQTVLRPWRLLPPEQRQAVLSLAVETAKGSLAIGHPPSPCRAMAKIKTAAPAYAEKLFRRCYGRMSQTERHLIVTLIAKATANSTNTSTNPKAK